jgi:hypothetical protein
VIGAGRYEQSAERHDQRNGSIHGSTSSVSATN